MTPGTARNGAALYHSPQCRISVRIIRPFLNRIRSNTGYIRLNMQLGLFKQKITTTITTGKRKYADVCYGVPVQYLLKSVTDDGYLVSGNTEYPSGCTDRWNSGKISSTLILSCCRVHLARLNSISSLDNFVCCVGVWNPA